MELEPWEKHSYREQPEYNPEDHCARCDADVGVDFIYEARDEDGETIFVCRECLKFYEEE